MRLLSHRLRSAGLVLAAALVLFAVVSTTPVSHTTASDHDELERTDINTFVRRGTATNLFFFTFAMLVIYLRFFTMLNQLDLSPYDHGVVKIGLPLNQAYAPQSYFDQTQQCVDMALAHNLLDKEDIKEIAAVVSEKLHISDTDHSDFDKKKLEGIVNNLHLDDFKHPNFAFSPGLTDKGKATVNFCRKHLDISSKPKKKNKGKKGLEARPFGQHGQVSGSREGDDEPEDDEMHESLTGDAPHYSEHHTQGHDSDHRGLQATHAGPNESQNGKSNDAWSPTSPHQAAPSDLGKRGQYGESDSRQPSLPTKGLAGSSFDLKLPITQTSASDLDYFKRSDSGTLVRRAGKNKARIVKHSLAVVLTFVIFLKVLLLSLKGPPYSQLNSLGMYEGMQPYEGNWQPYERNPNPQEWNNDRLRQCAVLSLREQILGQEEVDQITAVVSDKLGVPPDQLLAMRKNELTKKIRDNRLDREECDFPEPLDEKVTKALKRCQSKFEEGSTAEVKEIKVPGGRRGGPQDQRSNSRGENAEPEDGHWLHSFTKDPSRDSISHFYSYRYEQGDKNSDQDAPSSSYEKRSAHDESTTRQTSPSAGASFDLSANAASLSQTSASDLDHVGHLHSGALVRRSDEEERLLTTIAAFITLFCFHSFVLVCNLFDPTCTCPFPSAGLQPFERIPQPYESIPQGWNDNWIGQCAALSLKDHVLGEEDAKEFLEVVSKKVKKPADQLMAMDEKTFAKTVKNVRLDKGKESDLPDPLTKKSKEAVEHCQSKFDKGSTSKVRGEKRRRRRCTPHGRLSNSRGEDAEVDDDEPHHSLAKDPSPGSTAHLDSSRHRQGDEDSDQDGPSFSHHEKRSAYDDRDTRQISPSAGTSFDLLANVAPVTRTSASDLEHFDHSGSGALVRRRFNDYERIIVIVATLVMSFCFHSLFLVCNRYMTNCPCPNGGLQPFERNQQPYERSRQGWNDDWYGQCAALSLRDRTLRYEDAQGILEVVSKKAKMPADRLMAMEEKEFAKTVKDVFLDKWEKSDISEPLVGKAKEVVEHCRSTFDEGSTSKVKGEKRRRRHTSHGRLSNSRGEDSEIDDEPHHSLAKDPSPGSTAHLDSRTYGQSDDDSDHDAPSGHEKHEKRSARDESDTRQLLSSSVGVSNLSVSIAPDAQTSASDVEKSIHSSTGLLARRSPELFSLGWLFLSLLLATIHQAGIINDHIFNPVPHRPVEMPPSTRCFEQMDTSFGRQCLASAKKQGALKEKEKKELDNAMRAGIPLSLASKYESDASNFEAILDDLYWKMYPSEPISVPPALVEKGKELFEFCQKNLSRNPSTSSTEMHQPKDVWPTTFHYHALPANHEESSQYDKGVSEHPPSHHSDAYPITYVFRKCTPSFSSTELQPPTGALPTARQHDTLSPRRKKRFSRSESGTRRYPSHSPDTLGLTLDATPVTQTAATDVERFDHSDIEIFKRDRGINLATFLLLVLVFSRQLWPCKEHYSLFGGPSRDRTSTPNAPCLSAANKSDFIYNCSQNPAVKQALPNKDLEELEGLIKQHGGPRLAAKYANVDDEELTADLEDLIVQRDSRIRDIVKNFLDARPEKAKKVFETCRKVVEEVEKPGSESTEQVGGRELREHSQGQRRDKRIGKNRDLGELHHSSAYPESPARGLRDQRSKVSSSPNSFGESNPRQGGLDDSLRKIVQGPDPRHNGIPHDLWSTTSRIYAPPPSREERSDTRHPPPSSVGATFNYSAYRDRTPSSSMTELRDRAPSSRTTELHNRVPSSSMTEFRDRTPSSSMTELQRHRERHRKAPTSGPSKKEHAEPPSLYGSDSENEHVRRNLDSLPSHKHSDRAHTLEETELKRRHERPQERSLSLR